MMGILKGVAVGVALTLAAPSLAASADDAKDTAASSTAKANTRHPAAVVQWARTRPAEPSKDGMRGGDEETGCGGDDLSPRAAERAGQ